MPVLTEIHRASGINTQGRTIQRTAVRAVILRGRELLMVYSANVGDYKFPGGGVNVSETHAQALARELLEECGASLLSVDGEVGAIVEYNLPMEKDFDVFKMTSYYYLCRIDDGNFGAQKLDDYEADRGFQPIWIDIDQAIEANQLLLNTSVDWLRREIFALEYLKQNLLT
jgi:8-oxo-dGTP pyrophosphatase MutT (NUDIX family)